jgi:hypothetical protein
MYRLLVVFVFILALVGSAAVNIPLSFAMRISGTAERGLSWQQARGTVWDGQVSGLASSGVDLGTALIKADARSLFSGKPGFTLQLSSGAVQGSMELVLASQALQVKNLSINADLALLSNLKPELQRTGGTLSLQNSEISTERDGSCMNANGTVTLDTVRRVGILYGRDWPLLSGEVSCDAGAFLISLSGLGQAQETFDLTVRVIQSGTTQIKVKVANVDPEAALLLPALGFSNTSEGLVFYQDTSRPN